MKRRFEQLPEESGSVCGATTRLELDLSSSSYTIREIKLLHGRWNDRWGSPTINSFFLWSTPENAIRDLAAPINRHHIIFATIDQFHTNAQLSNTAYQKHKPTSRSSNSKMSIVRSNIFDPFSLHVWDPCQGFPFNTNHSLTTFDKETSAFVNTRIDWKETPEAHVFKVDLPGVKKEEVKVEVEEGNVLKICGERSREKEGKNDKWHRVERCSGQFLRRFRLPENAKVDQVRAAMENGVLTVMVPKEEVKKPQAKAIQIFG